MSVQQQSSKKQAQQAATTPPVMLFLPGIGKGEANTGARVAELMAIKLNKGAGSYTAEAVASPSSHLIDGRRIVKGGTGPVLDVYTLDYRPRLALSEITGSGAGAALRRFAVGLWYFARALFLVLSASRRAKSTIAKWQLLIGLGAVFVLLLSLVFTAMSVLVALDIWKEPQVADSVADAIALGMTALTTWLFFTARPAILRGATLLEQLLDYAQHERHADSVTDALTHALDDLIEAGTGRKVHIVGYSLGALVAIDFLHPRLSLQKQPDPRHAHAIASLVTIACPLDFVRLYDPRYTEQRGTVVPDLRWTNVYIAADVFGSNLIDGDDFAQTADLDGPPPVVIGASAPISYRYTSERLTLQNIWGRRGFLAHGGYWDSSSRENCLHLVSQTVIP